MGDSAAPTRLESSHVECCGPTKDSCGLNTGPKGWQASDWRRWRTASRSGLSRASLQPLARSAARTGGGAVEQQRAFTGVAREGCCPLELGARLLDAPELLKKIAAHAWQEVIILERRPRCQRIDDLKTRRRTEQHGQRHRTIELHDR